MAQLLAELDGLGNNPMPVGVFYKTQRPCYDEQFQAQAAEATQKLGKGDLEKLINAGDTWRVS